MVLGAHGIYTLEVQGKTIKRIGNFTKSTVFFEVWEFSSQIGVASISILGWLHLLGYLEPYDVYRVIPYVP